MSNSYALTVTFDGPNPTLVQENGQRLPTELVEIPDIPSGGLGPLARLKWIDGNTAIPSGEQTGTEGAPYGSPALWLATLLAPASADDREHHSGRRHRAHGHGRLEPKPSDVDDPGRA